MSFKEINGKVKKIWEEEQKKFIKDMNIIINASLKKSKLPTENMSYVGPYNNLPNTEHRIKNTFYYYKNGLRWWNGKRLIDKAKAKEYRDKPENKARAKELANKPENKAKAKEKRGLSKNKAHRKEYMNGYHQKNKAKAKEKRDKPENKAKVKEYNKKYRQKNKATAK